MNNFDLKKFLVENKLTSNSRLNEGNEYTEYLNDLRDSGVTNMFGAAPYLQAEFGLDKREAREVLANWMRSIGESLEEGKQLDQVDFIKVVKAVTQTGHPVTVLLTPKFNEIEVITGTNAPDDMLRDLSNAVDSLGYGRNGIIIAGDSSNLSRREYSDIRRVNGGHKDYLEENEIPEQDKVAADIQKAMNKHKGDESKTYQLQQARKAMNKGDLDKAKKIVARLAEKKELKENVTTTVWSNLSLQFLIDNKVRYVKGIGGNPQIDWHLIALGYGGAEEKALGQLDNWKASMEHSLGIEPHEEVRIEGGVITTDKIDQANDEAGKSQASAMKKGGFSNN